MDEPYAIISPENKALNFITWNGVNEFDYGQSAGNYLVPIKGIEEYGFDWIYNPQTNTFTNPNPIPPEETGRVVE